MSVTSALGQPYALLWSWMSRIRTPSLTGERSGERGAPAGRSPTLGRYPASHLDGTKLASINPSIPGHLTWREAAGQRSRRVGDGLGPAVGRCGHSHRALCVIILLVFAGSSAPVPPGGSLPKGVPRRAPQPRPRSPGSPRRRQPAVLARNCPGPRRDRLIVCLRVDRSVRRLVT